MIMGNVAVIDLYQSGTFFLILELTLFSRRRNFSKYVLYFAKILLLDKQKSLYETMNQPPTSLFLFSLIPEDLSVTVIFFLSIPLQLANALMRAVVQLVIISHGRQV